MLSSGEFLLFFVVCGFVSRLVYKYCQNREKHEIMSDKFTLILGGGCLALIGFAFALDFLHLDGSKIAVSILGICIIAVVSYFHFSTTDD